MKGKSNKINIAIADDHVLLRNGLANLIRNLNEKFNVVIEADNGKHLIDQLKKLNTDELPHIVTLDINMPEMDGFETALWLKNNHPGMKVMALSMYDNENSIIRMLKNGARGYIIKDTDKPGLLNALNQILEKGYYYSEQVTNKLIHNMYHEETSSTLQLSSLTDREIEFLKLVSTEMTYKEIAEKMNLSLRTIDGYRDSLFEKLNVKSRVGLVIYAIKNGLVTI
jgi:two-component system, NarL family, invasion response regulator UvrY